MKEVLLTVRVRTEDDVSDASLTNMIKQLLLIGSNDAKDSLDCDFGDASATAQAAATEVISVQMKTTPRILIRVEGGIVEFVSDQEINGFVCYLDAGTSDPAFDHAPLEFADLAEKLGLPVLGADHE